MLLGSSHRNSNNRNLQTIIMFRCYYKLHNAFRMCSIFSFNSLYNLRNWMHLIRHMLILYRLSWLCLGN